MERVISRVKVQIHFLKFMKKIFATTFALKINDLSNGAQVFLHAPAPFQCC